jgi:hypothetical protein
MQKYFKPKSVTWWGGFSTVCAGAFMAAEPIHELETVVETLHAIYGLGPAALISAGMTAIGARGAIPDA